MANTAVHLNQSGEIFFLKGLLFLTKQRHHRHFVNTLTTTTINKHCWMLVGYGLEIRTSGILPLFLCHGHETHPGFFRALFTNSG